MRIRQFLAPLALLAAFLATPVHAGQFPGNINLIDSWNYPQTFTQSGVRVRYYANFATLPGFSFVGAMVANVPRTGLTPNCDFFSTGGLSDSSGRIVLQLWGNSGPVWKSCSENFGTRNGQQMLVAQYPLSHITNQFGFPGMYVFLPLQRSPNASVTEWTAW